MSRIDYTPAKVAELQAAQPINWQKRQDFASQWGGTPRSVQAKAVSLGLEYVKLSPVKRAAKADTPTKAEYLSAIRKALALPDREGDLTKVELTAVLESIG